MAWDKGMPILYWPGIRTNGIPGLPGAIISDGVVRIGGTDCLRISKDNGGTDYIALTHVEPAQ